MKKTTFTLVIFILLSLSVVSHATAVATLPTETVWVTPVDTRAGEKTTLNALVYNSEKQDITFTVSFTIEGKEVGTGSATIKPAAAQTISSPILTPVTSTVVTAQVQKALTKQNKDIVALHGVLGTVTIGETIVTTERVVTPVLSSFPTAGAVQAWIQTHASFIELFRKQQADHFAIVRDTAKKNLGITLVKNIEDKYNTALNVPAVASSEIPARPADTTNGPGNYAALIYGTSLASFFSHQLLFYCSIVFLVFVLLRLIVKRFI